MRRLVVTRRGLAGATIVLVATAIALLGRSASGDERVLWALPDPTEATLRELAGRSSFDVRWVESGLVILETGGDATPPGAWRAQRIATRTPDLEVGILRAGDLAEWRKPGGEATAARVLESLRTATLEADAGEVWVLLAPPAAWPAHVIGCHGGVVLLKHGLDPRSSIDQGPPRVLAPYLASRPLTGAENRVVAAISADSLLANLQRITLDAFARPADRYVWNSDLELIYAPRVETVMQRAVAGIAGAEVRRQWYAPRSTTPNDTTYNVIARLPGSVPGTGTFVVCAHLDAIGLRDTMWARQVRQGLPVQTPGAEDNATGVACVLEMLRATSDAIRANQVDFAFDLEFIAFSAEEIGLLGSEHYVRQETQAGTPLLGAFNFDMVGYDSLAGNLQVVRNPASTWLSDLVQTAAAGLTPPTPLDVTPEIDESRASDHNSFWTVNSAGILFADADVNTLRRYPTYHTPSDVLGRPPTVLTRIQVPKLVEVTRVLQASLLRFDTRAYSQPLLRFAPENLSLRREIQGVLVRYDPSFHQLWPGTSLEARLVVQSLGAPFAAPLGIRMETSGPGGAQTVLDSTATWSLPTGAQAVVTHKVPIPGGAHGMQILNAVVTYPDSAGAPIVQTAQDTFYVQEPGQLTVQVRPNPARGNPSVSKVAVEVSAPGEIRVEVYDLEGQRISVNSRTVVPLTFAKYELPVLATSPSNIAADLASGAYILRVLWTGSNGGSATATARWVVIR